MRGLLLWSSVVLACTPPPPRVSPKINEAVAAVRARAGRANTAWRRGLQEHGYEAPVRASGRCPLDLPEPPPIARLLLGDVPGVGAEVEAVFDRFVVVRRDRLADGEAEAPVVRRALRKLGAELLVGESTDELGNYLALMALKEALADDLTRQDLTFVAADLSYPTPGAPGRARGRGLVWDHRTRAVVCAADLSLHAGMPPELVADLGSASLADRPDVRRSIEAYFELEILRALRRRLVRLAA